MTRKKTRSSPDKPEPTRPPGAPRTAMTEEKVEEILQTVRLGVWPDTAARRHGVNPSTMRSLRADNEEFRTALEKAEAEAEIGFHGRILRASTGTPAIVERDAKGRVVTVEHGIKPVWTAAAWMLERRWPERYADHRPPLIGELNVGEGGKVEVNGPPMPEPGQWKEWVEKLAEVTTSLDEAETQNGLHHRGDSPVPIT